MLISFFTLGRINAPLLGFDLGDPAKAQSEDRWKAAENRAVDARAQGWERDDIRHGINGPDDARRARIRDQRENLERLSGREPQDIVRLSEKAKDAYAALQKLGKMQVDLAKLADASGVEILAQLAVMSRGADDVVAVDGPATVLGGAGDDAVSVQHDSVVDGGSGDDFIEGWDRLAAHGGAGRDTIEGHHDAVLNGGAGDDVLNAYAGGFLSGGVGHDVITGYDRTRADGGDGDDYIETYGESTLSGGAGADMIRAYGSSVLDGGTGDDLLLAGETSVFTGGGGNDYVSGARNSTINYARGDGHDRVGRLLFDSTLAFGAGISRSDVSAAVDEYGLLHISIGEGGGEGSITVEAWSADATITFEDGSATRVRELIPDYQDPPPDRMFDLSRQFRFRRMSGDLAS